VLYIFISYMIVCEEQHKWNNVLITELTVIGLPAKIEYLGLNLTRWGHDPNSDEI
jgi:hypothetical protein